MTSRTLIFSSLACGIPLLALLATAGIGQRSAQFDDVAQSRDALQQAQAQQRAAERRALSLEGTAKAATQAAERTAREAAALAARIQQSEAGIAVAEARIAMIDRQQQALRSRMAERQKPIIGLTAALQNFSRRPAALSVLRPGSVRDVVYLRAMLSSAAPEVARRTADIRAELARGRELQREAQQAIGVLRAGEDELEQRRAQLAALETRQRLEARELAGTANREAERALALAEEARDLDTLVNRLDRAGDTRRQLAALPGPILRPARPDDVSDAVPATPAPAVAESARPPAGFRLPVDGRTVAGFGSVSEGGVRSEGVTLAPRGAAQIVAPAAGRVAFAGSYRGYGRIVIIEHAGGWTSLITGLVRLDVQVGDNLVSGSPIGIAAPERPAVTLELRRDGEPVNPLDYVG